METTRIDFWERLRQRRAIARLAGEIAVLSVGLGAVIADGPDWYDLVLTLVGLRALAGPTSPRERDLRAS